MPPEAIGTIAKNYSRASDMVSHISLCLDRISQMCNFYRLLITVVVRVSDVFL